MALRGLAILAAFVASVANATTPTFSSAFSPSTIAPGATTTLTFTIDHSANAIGVSGVGFSNTLPAGMTIKSPSNAQTTCINGSFTANAGSDSITFSGYRVGGNTSCTFSLDVTSSTVGSHTNTTSVLGTSAGNVTAASSTLTVDSTRAGFSMAFSPATITPGAVSRLTYTIDNSLNGSNLTFMRFTHTLSSGLSIASNPEIATTCAGTFKSVTGTPAGTTLNAQFLDVAAGASCTVSVNVTAAEAGTYTTETGELTQNGANPSGTATAQLTVETPFLNMTFPNSAAPGQLVTLSYTMTNADRSNDATGISFTNDLNATLSGLAATALPSTGFCGAGSTISGTSNITISNASLTSGTSCSFEITVQVPSNAIAGTYTNSTSTVNLTLGSATTKAAASNSLTVVQAPTLTAQFLESPAVAGQDITARFTITNTDSVNQATDILFNHYINENISGMQLKTLPASGSCGSGSTFASSTGSNGEIYFKVDKAVLNGGSSCTFDAIYTLPTDAQPGSFQITSDLISATVSGSTVYGNSVSPTIVIINAPILTFGITENSATPGSTVTAQFTLNYNANATADATNIAFTTDLNAALSGLVSTTATQSDICGSGSSLSGTSTLTFSGGRLSPGSSCTFSATLQVPAGATPGEITAATSAVSGTVSNTNVSSSTASDTLTISGLNLSHTFVTNPVLANQSSSIRYTITNSASAPAATAIQFSHNLSTIISGLTSTALPSTPCNGSSVMSGPTNLSFSGGELQPGASCTFDVTVSVPANASEGTFNSVTSAMSATVNSNNTSTPASGTTLTVEALTVQLSTTASATTSTSPIPVAVDFSRDVTGFTLSDLTVTNGSAGNLSGSGRSYSVDITPSTDGTVSVNLPADTVTDSVVTSIQNPASNTVSVTYAATPAVATPTIALSSASVSSTSSGPVTYTATYSNAETVNLTTSAITLNKTGTANASVAVTNGTTSTATVTLSSITGDGTLGFSIAASTARNGTENAAATGPSGTFTVDNTQPTVSITGPTAPTNAAFTATITFSEDVSNFIISDITATNASLSNFNTTSASVYTVTVTPTSEGAVNLDIAAGVADDSAGNTNTAATQFSISYDVTAPTVVISGQTGSLNSAFTATFTFSEDVTGFASSDIVATNASISNFSSTSAKVYTATVTPAAEGSVNLDLAANSAVDSAQNGNTAANQFSIVYDVTGPTITSGNISLSGASGSAGAFKTGDTLTAVWNNTAGGDNNNDVSTVAFDFSSFGGGASVTASNTSGSWSASYTFVAGAIDGTNLNVSVTATDNAGNPSTTAGSSNATADNIAPTLTDGNISISGATGASGVYKVGDTLTATWNNAVNGDNNSDTISSVTADFSSFGGGSAVTASNSSGTWSAVYTIASNSTEGTNLNVSVTVTDNAGNSTTTADGSNATVDATAPVISSVSIQNQSHKVGDTVTATITVSSDSDTYTLGASSIAGYSLGNLNKTNDTTYTATFTINDGGADVAAGSDIPVSVVLTDVAGNSNTPYTSAISQANDSVYANLPDITLTSDINAIAEDGGVSTLTTAITGTLDNKWPEAITVSLGYTGTATNGTDYTASASPSATSVSIAAGQSSATATVTATADSIYDATSSETIIVDITTVTIGSESGVQQQTITITDAESQPTLTLSVDNATINENGGTTTPKVTMSNASFEDITVVLAYSGTATAAASGADYNSSASTSVTISKGGTEGTAATAITSVDDTDSEGSETIIIDMDTITGNASESGTQQVTVTIQDDDNTAPVLGSLNGVATFTEDGSAVILDSDVTVTDSEFDRLNNGATNYTGGLLTIVRSSGANSNDQLAVADGTNFNLNNQDITSTSGQKIASFNSNAGTFTINFTGDAATPTRTLVNEILQNITYSNSSQDPTANVVLNWVFSDGALSSSGGTNVTNVTVTPVNDAPTLDNSKSPLLTTIAEDESDSNNTGTTISDIIPANTINNIEAAQTTESIVVTNVDNTNGIWQYTVDNGTNWNNFSTTTASAVDLTAASGARLLSSTSNNNKIRFVPNLHVNGSSTITFRAWDEATGTSGNTADVSTTGGSSSFSSDFDTASITITAGPDDPVIGNLNGDILTYVQDSGALVIDQSSDATLTDPDTNDLNGGALTVSITSGEDSAEDQLSVDGTNVTLSSTSAGGNVTVGGIVVGTLGNSIGAGANVVVNFNANATTSNIQTLIRNITYQNLDTTGPTTGNRTVSFSVNDGTRTAEVNATVAVNAVDRDATAVAGSTTSSISSLQTTSAKDLWSFTLSDAGTADGKSVSISSIVLHTSGTLALGQIDFTLTDSVNSNAINGTYDNNANTLTFVGNYSVANSASTVFTLAAKFNTNSNLTDGSSVTFSLDADTDISTATNGTRMATSTSISSNAVSVDVLATQLVFATQPSGATSGLVLTGQLLVQARDVAGNIDSDFNDTVTLTEASAGDLSGTTSIVASAGQALFNDIIYTATADNEAFVLTANDTASGTEGDLNPVNSANVTSDVVATTLVFTAQPAPASLNSEETTNFTTVPVISALNAQGTLDTDFITPVVLTESGAGTAVFSGTGDTDSSTSSVTLTPTNGVTTYTGLSITYTASGANAENFNLTVDAAGVTGATSSPITAITKNTDATVVAGTVINEPVSIPTTATGVTSATSIFDFAIVDGGTSDNKPLNISQLVIHISGTLDASKLVYLLNGNDTSNAVGSYSANSNTVTFNNLAISVAHGTQETYTLSSYFADNTNLTDGQTLILSTDGDTDFTTDSNNTQITTTSPVTNGDGSTVNVTATQLVFTTQPSGSISGIALTTQPVVQAQDAVGNVDRDFVEVVTLTDNAAGTVSNAVATAISGLATFTGFTYTASQDNESVTIIADDVASSGSDLPAVNATSLSSNVVATKVIFATEPAPQTMNSGVANVFTTVPVLSAVDAQNTVDRDYTSAVTVSEVNGAGSATISATTDTDGDSTTVTNTFSAGSVTLAGLSATYTVAGDGNESFNLQAASGTLVNGTSALISVNDSPTLVNAPSSLTVVEDQLSNLDLSAIVVGDTDGDRLTATLTVNRGTLSSTDGNVTTNGVTIIGSGASSITLAGNVSDLNAYFNDATKLRYLSAANDDTSDTLSITLNDGVIDGGATTISIAITPINDAPTISGTPQSSVIEDGVYSFTAVANDIENDTLTFNIINKPSWATFDQSTGILTGTPTNDNVGSDTNILISVSDGQLSASLPEFTVDVINSNDAPVINQGQSVSVTMSEDGEPDAFSLNLTVTDVDVGDTQVWSISSQASLGNASIGTNSNSEAIIAYTPVANVNGNDSFEVQVSDGSASDSITVNVSILPINDAPFINQGDEFTINLDEDTLFSSTLNATDFENETLTWSVANQATKGTASVTTTGESSTLSYQPNDNEFGSDSFVVEVSDGTANDTISVNVSIAPINDAPIISGIPSTSVLSGQTYRFEPIVQDVDNEASSLTFSIQNKPDWASFDNQTGVLSGLPTQDNVGNFEGIIISVSDGEFVSVLDAFNIEVVATNEAPVATAVEITTNEDNSVAITLVGTDADGDELTYIIETQPQFGSVELSGAIANYLPNANSNGQDSFTYRVSDGIADSVSALVTVNIIAVNDAPTIEGTPVLAVELGNEYRFAPTANDVDEEDSLTFSISVTPAWASFNTDTGVLSGTPMQNDVGTTEGIIISVSDGDVSVSLDSFNIEVVDPNFNFAPVAEPIIGVTNEDEPVNLTLIGSDDNGDALTFKLVTEPENGVAIIVDDQLTYTPNANFNTLNQETNQVEESEVFTYVASDGVLDSEPMTISLSVVPVNDAPVVNNSPSTMAATFVEYRFAPDVTDVDGDTLSFSIENKPSWATFEQSSGLLLGTPERANIGVSREIKISVTDGEVNVEVPSFDIEVTDTNRAPVVDNVEANTLEDTPVEIALNAQDADGDQVSFRVLGQPEFGSVQVNGTIMTYSPSANVGGVMDTVEYVANDGIVDSPVGLISILIEAVNDAPEITGEAPTSVRVGQTFDFSPSANDVENDTLTFVIENKPIWTVFDASTGALSGSPSNANLGTYGNITIGVSDGEITSYLAPFNIEVVSNQAPTISGSSVSAVEVGTSYSFTPQATDPEGDALSFSIQNKPVWTEFDTGTGTLSGIPIQNNVGVYNEIIITVSDGVDSTSLAPFTIEVCDICGNVAPTITGVPPTLVSEGELYLFVPTAADVNGDSLTFSIINQPVWANFDASTGSLSGTPSGNDVGTTNGILISVSDGEFNASMPAFNITVVDVNAPPVITGTPPNNIFRDSQYSFTPSASDPDGDLLTFNIVNRPAWASFNPNTGSLRGIPDRNEVGIYSEIVISVSDASSTTSLAAFDIEVLATNSAPTISGTPRTGIIKGEAYSFTPQAFDADGDTLVFNATGLPTWLALDTISGALTGTPTVNDVGSTDAITVSVSDGQISVSLASFIIEVTSANNAPTAVSSNVILSEDSAFEIVADAVDVDGDEMTFTVVTQPQNGTLTESQLGWTFTPEENFAGDDSFVFFASDGELSSENATVNISVEPVNDSPVAVADNISVDQNAEGIYTLDVINNDTDVDIVSSGDSLLLQGADADFGSVTIVNNQLEFNPGASFIGSVNLVYAIRDSAGASDQTQVVLTINGVVGIGEPTVVAPDDINANATGLFTTVELGAAVATDADGNPLPATNLAGDASFAPGANIVYWQTEDSFGTTATDSQTVNISPLISFGTDKVVSEGASVSVDVFLNGDSPAYPFTVNYSVSGTASGEGIDHDASSGSITFTSGREQMIVFEVFTDSEIEVDETIIFTLDDGQNKGANSETTVIISDENIVPEIINITVSQNGETRATVAKDQGAVSIEGTVTDKNPQDSLLTEWSSNSLNNISQNENTFIFDPSDLTEGVYQATLFASDDGDPVLSVTEDIFVEVVATLPLLSSENDTDGDLIPDDQEGYGDSDGDGIPDYLDAIDDCNVVPDQAQVSQNEFLIESEPGACLREGPISSLNEDGLGVNVQNENIRVEAKNAAGKLITMLAEALPEDAKSTNVGGIFDFVMYDLSQGDATSIVLPQRQPVPATPLYRMYDSGEETWSDFTIDDSNQVFSTVGERGNCPPPGDDVWVAGLIEGNWCVQLRIQDGGLNDNDKATNGAVLHSGGVGIIVSDNQLPIALDDTFSMRWNTSLELNVLANDSDPDGDSLSVSNATSDFGMVLVDVDGMIDYTPNTGFVGKDTVVYTIDDGNGGTASAQATVDVKGNRAPGALADSAETDDSTPVEVDVLANDIDVDGDPISLISASAEVGGVEITEIQTLLYTPKLGFDGLDTITYVVADEFGGSATTTVSVVVDGNQAPQALNDSVETAFNTDVTVNVLSNDMDVNGDTLTVISAIADNGSVVINDDSSLTYSPASNFSGVVEIQYTISDGVLEASAILTVTVLPEPVETISVVGKSSGGVLSYLWMSYLLLLLSYKLILLRQQRRRF